MVMLVWVFWVALNGRLTWEIAALGLGATRWAERGKQA